MTTKKVAWQGGIMWWIWLGAMILLVRRAILFLVPIIPQRAELWLTNKWRIVDLPAYFSNYIAIPGEIIGAAIIAYAVVGLFCREEGKSELPRSPRMALSGIALGSVFSIPLVLIPPYGLAVSVAFAAGFFAMIPVAMEISGLDSLYSGFGTVMGIAITTFIVYGGYVAAVVMIVLVVVNIIGIFCGLIIGDVVRYIRKRWFL